MRLLLISPKHVYATQRLLTEAKTLDIKIALTDVKELVQSNYEVNPVDFDALYIRQAYVDFEHQASVEQLQGIIGLARRFEKAGKAVVDQSIAQGDLGQGKFYALMKLQQHGIVIPQTRLLGEEELSNLNQDFDKALLWQLGQLPLIAKWNYGFGGKHTYLINMLDDLPKIIQPRGSDDHKHTGSDANQLDSKDKKPRTYPANEIMVQEFIPADFEYKIITVGYKSIPVILKLKTNHNKFLPDLRQYQVWPVSDASAEVVKVIQLAEQSSRILKRELAKVDILQAGNQLYILEVNRWPGLQYFEKTTKYSVAQDFLQYIAAKSSFKLG